VLNKIVDRINSHWKADAFKSALFRDAELIGLCSQIPINDGDNVVFDIIEHASHGGAKRFDLHNVESSVSIYHRLMSVSRNSSVSGFGDDINSPVVSYNMSALVFVNQQKTNLFAHQIEMLLNQKLLQQFGFSDLPEGYESINVISEGSEFNQRYLFEREFNLKHFTMEPRIVLFEFKYQLECTVNNDCIKSICCP
jgi:hypothetical protein